MYTIILLVFLVIALIVIFKKKENMISLPAYMQVYNGLNLPVDKGNYLGGMGVIWNAENADNVNKIKL